MYVQSTCGGLLQIALFEVLQDMNDSKQFLLLPRDLHVNEKVQQWRARQLKYVKVVIPMYGPAKMTDLGPGRTKISTLKANATFKQTSQEGQVDPPTDKSKSSDTSLEPSVQVLFLCMYVCLHIYVFRYKLNVCVCLCM